MYFINNLHGIKIPFLPRKYLSAIIPNIAPPRNYPISYYIDIVPEYLKLN
jgi:hypothetical protein